MYATVRDIRVHNDWMPVRVESEEPSRPRSRILQLSKRPIVDGDFDGSVLGDIEVLVDGARIGPESVDAETGLVVLPEDPPAGSSIAVSYYWHPISDREIGLALAKAAAEVELVTGRRFGPYRARERVVLTSGSIVRLGDRVVEVESVKIYTLDGQLLDSAAGFELIDPENGLLRIKGYEAGRPSGPFFIPSALEVEVTYTAGYTETPDYIRQYTIMAATLEVLLRFQRMLSVERSYGDLVLVVKAPGGLGERIEQLRAELERFREILPKPVRRV
jgi:hypothetical protein